MPKKNILLIVVSSLLILSIILQTPIGTQFHLQIKPVKAEKTIIVPTNYTKIQDAINAADPEDTIYVYNGTYYEHVVVNKTVTLIGENKSTTIIDGEGTGIVIRSDASDVQIIGFTIQNGGASPYSGVSIGSCINNTIRDNIIRNNAYGLTLIGSNGCSIIGNMIMNNSDVGILIRDSSNNTILENTVVKNPLGVWITSLSSENNTLYYNNFIDNSNQVQSFSFTTHWDNGTAGNYWSDYTGEDSDGNGIGDSSYTIPFFETDNYPLMKPFGNIGDLARPIIGTPHQEPLDPSDGENVIISVNVTDKESGVHNVTLSYSINEGADWMDVPMTNLTDTYVGQIPGQSNGTEVWYKITAYDNAGNFAVNNNIVQHYVYTVVPEFPAIIFLSLFIIFTLVTVILMKRSKGIMRNSARV